MFCKQNNKTPQSQTLLQTPEPSVQTYPKHHFPPRLLVWIQFINVISSHCFNVSFMPLSEIYHLKNTPTSPNSECFPEFSNYNNQWKVLILVPTSSPIWGTKGDLRRAVSVIHTGGCQSQDSSKFSGCAAASAFTKSDMMDINSKQIIPFWFGR